MATAFPDIAVSQSVTRTTERDVLAVRYGNGYEQRMANGINYRRDTWQITWDGVSQTDKDTLIAFLEATSDGSVITWTSPFDVVEKKFALEGEYMIQDTGGQVYTIACKLRQVYDIT